MTKFADQLFDDLMREHGSTLDHHQAASAEPARRDPPGACWRSAAAGSPSRPPRRSGGHRRRHAPGHSADAAGGNTPAYALTPHANGTITLAVYQKSGIAAANAKLHELGDSQVYVVPVGAGCPSMSSLPAPAAPLNGKHLERPVERDDRRIARRLGDREREGHPGRRHPRGGGRDDHDRQHDDVTGGGEGDHGARAPLREPAVVGRQRRLRVRVRHGQPGINSGRRTGKS